MTGKDLPALPGLPRDAQGPVFAAPWEAQVFALALSLHEKGVFSWPEWAAALASEIKSAQASGDPDTGETYYRHWLKALERLVVAKGIATGEVLGGLAQAWDLAARTTPHGQPITLRRSGP
jgi:nitrile hydratase accessory protein